jgi:hypothetical protein
MENVCLRTPPSGPSAMTPRPCPSHRLPLLAAALLLCAGPAPGSEIRRELFNRSGHAWRLALVEGIQANLGRMRIIDKFSGKTVTDLDKTGASLTIPAGARYLVEFGEENRAFFRDLILQDEAGSYVEYLARVPFLADPAPVLFYKDRHVGPPLDRDTDEAVLRRIEDAISTADGNLIIRQDSLCPRTAPRPVP